jgi:two-component system cell cycle response regulator DivK
MREDRERSERAGCDGYVTKPLRYQQLYALINDLLARRST